MKIELITPESGDERQAGNWLRNCIRELWPDLDDHPTDKVRIQAAAKLPGRKVQDLDLVLLAEFDQPRPFAPTVQFRPYDGEPVKPRSAAVANLILVIEIKSHRAEGIRFEGLNAQVKYQSGRTEKWSDASEQSHKQLHALKHYIKDQRLPQPFITNLLLFPNLREEQLPERPHNFIAGDASFTTILNSLGEIAKPVIDDDHALISAGPPEKIAKLAELPLFRSLTPTSLDRKRMDRIISTDRWRREWFDDLGKSQVILRGHGGAGKTVIMLQLAYRAFDEHAARSLILTYNRALIADIRRTMALLGIPSDVADSGVTVEPIMSFISRILGQFGLIGKDFDFSKDYEPSCAKLAELIWNGDVSESEIARIKRSKGEKFNFDHVFVDEGQDWPSAEIEILRAFYPPQNLVIADGIHQSVRGSNADWTGGVDLAKRRIRRLRKCLRMKANLANFANAVAQELRLDIWEVQPNDDADGGRVIIVEGDYFRNLTLHDQLLVDARKAGNEAIDLLMCIPPSMARNPSPSRAAAELSQHGYAVWDGTITEVRKNFPKSIEQLRVVQYDSCRGLEGWIVFALGFDDFWEYKVNQGRQSGNKSDDLFSTHETAAHEQAAKWAMIPLTRAMDTLVLQVAHRNTYVGKALRRVAERHPDFVEWISR